MARPRTEPAERRRERILDAARTVMVRVDYKDIRLEDVARQARLAKGTIYLYFKSKDELVSAVFADILADLELRIGRSGTSDPLEALRAIGSEHLSFIDENRDFLTQVLRQDPVFDRDASAPLREGFAKHIDALARRIGEAVSAGLLKPHDPRMGALFFMCLMRMFLTRKLLTGDPGPLRDHAGTLVDLFLNGLGSGRAP
jgi:TetR/AcrR family fatty acid metabolism transcriptional regulator